MEIVDLSLEAIKPSDWNPNEMDSDMLDHLRCSIQKFNLVVPIVVREVGKDQYETIGGAQRLTALRELGMRSVPCVIVQANGAEARLLGQALNHIAGTDNLGLRAEVLRGILESKSQEEVLGLLPETAASLQALTAMGEQSIAQAFQQWEQIQKARLRHMAFQLTDAQLEVVEEVMQRLLPLASGQEDSPNKRGSALYRLCLDYLERRTNENQSVMEDRS